LPDGPKGEYLTDRLTSEAIKLLEQNGDDPFFMYMSYYSVHMPIQVPEENIKKYRKKAEKMGLDKQEAFEEGKYYFIMENFPIRKIPLRIIQSDPAYAGMIDRLDHNIGRLLDTLKQIGKYDDTIIIFYSDNGGLSNHERAPTCNLPLRDGKSYVYEGGIREPLLIKWKGVIQPGSTCDQPITATDFYPTLLEACNMELIPEQHVDGKSFLPLLEDPSIDWDRGPLFWHYPHYNGNGALPGSFIIDGKWKLIEWLENGEAELFNLENDVAEEKNVASEYPEIKERLLRKLKELQEETGAKMPEPNPNYPYFLARTYVHINGTLVMTGDEGACIKARLTKDNPNIYDVPIGEVIDPFFDKMVKFKIENDFRVGRFHLDEDEKLLFTDTHAEKTFPIESLLEKLANSKISIQAWDDIQLDYLGADEARELKSKTLEPQVEIRAIDKIDVNLSFL
ncbi:MAG: sulfatase-like hydrolase/transferase, partial [Candidatus Hodarchaeota archaeon]